MGSPDDDHTNFEENTMEKIRKFRLSPAEALVFGALAVYFTLALLHL
jgi:hypothetical protein